MRHAARIRMMIMYALRAVLTQCLARDCVERCVGFARVGHRPLRQSTGCVEGAIRGRRGARHGCIMAYVGVCGFDALRWRPHAASCSTPGGGPGAVITLRRGDVHRPRRAPGSHGPRGPAAVIPPRTSVRASFGPVLSPSEKCRTRCAGRAVRGARRCGSVQSRPAPRTRPCPSR